METSPSQLPAPDDWPHSDVVIYDGECAFCLKQVSVLMRWDRKNRLAFISLHDPRVAEWFPDLSREQLMRQMYVVPASQAEKRLGGAVALRYLSRRLPRLWWLAPWLHIPGSLFFWQFLYRQVARNRYRLAQKRGDACRDGGSCGLHGK